MKITTQLIQVMDAAQPPAAILAAALGVIARSLDVDASSMFRVDEAGELAPGATCGHVDRGVDLAAEVLSTKHIATSPDRLRVASPMFLRHRLVGVLVLQHSPPREFSEDDLVALGAICAALVGLVEKARLTDTVSRGKPLRVREVKPGLGLPPDRELALTGVGASPGIAIGTAVLRRVRRLERSAKS